MLLNLVKSLIAFKSKKVRKDFLSSLENPQQAQETLLKEILELSQVDALPTTPTTYLDYKKNASWTKERIVFFEPTSGSSGTKKEIPYTKSLLKSFENMFLLWAVNFAETYSLTSGKIFISISPKVDSSGTFDESEYLSQTVRFFLKPFLVLPKSLKKIKDEDSFFLNLSVSLISEKNLEIVSVWSPTYFLSLLNWIGKNINALKEAGVSQTDLGAIRAEKWAHLWPNLKVISCWTDSYSEQQAKRLHAKLPHSKIQGKGLLCTEGPVTIPWGDEGLKLPLWTEVYLEYLNDAGEIRPLYKMSEGERGVLLISTKGGALRYNLNDVVGCEKKFLKSPSLSFYGRSNNTSDLVGEKLSENLVFEELSKKIESDWVLFPYFEAHQAGYVLLVDKEVELETIERTLQCFYHYKVARDLGQMKSLKKVVVASVESERSKLFGDKIRIGDQKVKFLISDFDDSLQLAKNLNLHT